MRSKPKFPRSSAVRQFSLPGCYDCYEFMGAHPVRQFGEKGWMFRVWAPNATAVSVVGQFNDWDPQRHPMTRVKGGIWSKFIPGLQQYDTYQYCVCAPDGACRLKADPFAFHAETRPGTASKLYDLSGYQWGDENWVEYRKRMAEQDMPHNTYEVHLGSWRRTGQGEVINYRTMASYLVPYVKEMGYTNVLLMPVGEHPDDESLGYQESGCFAVTSRFGTPTDFMYLVDQLHQAGVGVVMDCTSLNFSTEVFSLSLFDGTPCFGIPDPAAPGQELEQFDFSKPQVENFAVSYVFFWMKIFHLDGFFYTNVDLSDASLVRRIAASIQDAFPYRWESIGTPATLLDSSRTWYSRWTETILERITDPERTDPILSAVQVPTPGCILPISHHIVSAPHPSLVARMQGDVEQKFAQARAFYLLFLTQPGRKLTMMGTEFGQWDSWNCLQSLDWHLLENNFYRNYQRFFRSANALFLATPVFWRPECALTLRLLRDEGRDQCILFSLRESGTEYLVASCFSLYPQDVEAGVEKGAYEVLFSTDAWDWGGQGRGSMGTVLVRDKRLRLSLPPMTTLVLRSTKPKTL